MSVHLRTFGYEVAHQHRQHKQPEQQQNSSVAAGLVVVGGGGYQTAYGGFAAQLCLAAGCSTNSNFRYCSARQGKCVGVAPLTVIPSVHKRSHPFLCALQSVMPGQCWSHMC